MVTSVPSQPVLADRRSFSDKVQYTYAFSSAYSLMEDLTPTRPAVGAPVNLTPDTLFPLGDELVHTLPPLSSFREKQKG